MGPVTCVEVRDRLAEHALGLLDQDQLWQIERHLEWCAGCRKESAELHEGAEAVGLALPQAVPRPAVEERVVHEVLTAAGKRPRVARRRTFRVMAVATLAAAIMAIGAVGWGFSQRHRADELTAEVDNALKSKEGLAALVETFRTQFQTTGTVFQAALYPGPARQPAGTAVVFTAPRGSGFALVQVVTPLPAAEGPFSVVLVDRNGHTRTVGQLGDRRADGHYILANTDLTEELARSDSAQLAHLTGLTIVGRSGDPVLTGTFRSSP
jgi:predicted anti-sigma-YlaC factor YlaD